MKTELFTRGEVIQLARLLKSLGQRVKVRLVRRGWIIRIVSCVMLLASCVTANAGGHGFNSGFSSSYASYNRGAHSAYNHPAPVSFYYPGLQTYTLTYSTPAAHVKTTPEPSNTQPHYPANDGSKIFISQGGRQGH